MSALVPLEVVRSHILDSVPDLPVVDVPLRDAAGHATAEPVDCREPVPPFDNSAMDGYAVRATDTAGASEEAPAELRVVADLPAGHAPAASVGPGEAVRIMTGAVVPDGADAIVMVESTESSGDSVVVRAAAMVGDHIRRAGGDLRPGDRVLDTGTTLGPAHVGVLASVGHTTVSVRRAPRVGVLSTGDELVDPDASTALAPGQIRDANRPMLLEVLGAAGCTPVDLGIARDDEDLIVELLSGALGESGPDDAHRDGERSGVRCDAVLTSGGVSVGDYDYVKAALERLGSLTSYRVAIKPAKPLAFGSVNGRPVFGLPGNPVSSLVSFELFARPALRQMAGHRHRFRPEVEAVAEEDMRRRPDGKVHFDRVVASLVDGAYRARRSGSQSSNVLSATAAADGLAILPDGEGVSAGQRVRVLLMHAPADH